MQRHVVTHELIAAMRLGLLDASAERRVKAHLATCLDCMDYWHASRLAFKGFKGEQGHIPASLLSRWPKTIAETTGLRRHFLRHHLAGCDKCRGALSLMGQEPVLPVVAALEPSAAQLQDVTNLLQVARAESDAEQDAETPVPHFRVLKDSFRTRVVRWISPFYGLATTVAVLILLAMRLPQATMGGMASTRATIGQGGSSTAPLLVGGLGEAALVVDLAPDTSFSITGDSAAADHSVSLELEDHVLYSRIPRVLLRRGEQEVRLSLPRGALLGLDRGSATVSIHAGGRTIFRRSLVASDGSSPGEGDLTVVLPAGSLRRGGDLFEVVVLSGSGSRPDKRLFPFRVQRG